MKINIYDNYTELSESTADFIKDYVKEKPSSILCFAAGDTPKGTFENLVQYVQANRISFKDCLFVGLDEWVGMDEQDEGSCKHFMYTHLFRPLKIEQDRIFFFDACAEDLEFECRRIDAYVREKGPIDLMLVGIGVNGHIGLNEPGISFENYSHVVELSANTREVAQKYFKDQTPLEKGITLGLQHLMEAETVVLIASGSRKAPALKQAVEGEVTNAVPASILQRHPNCYLFVDKDAASMLDVEVTGSVYR